MLFSPTIYALMLLCQRVNLWGYLRHRYVKTKAALWNKYLRGGLLVDVVSILPFDMVGMVFESDSLSSLKVLRVIRLCRLIKLLRILKASRVLKRVQDSLDMSFTAMSLIKFFVSVMVVVHWTACTWGMVPNIEESEVNWTTESAFESVADGREVMHERTRHHESEQRHVQIGGRRLEAL